MKRIAPILLLFLGATALAEPLRLAGDHASIEFDVEAGSYRLLIEDGVGSFAGNVGEKISDAKQSTGDGALGRFSEVSFRFPDGARRGVIRAYADRPIVEFAYTLTGAATSQPSPFPDFTQLPKDLLLLSHQNEVFATPAYGKAVETSTPWLMFDRAGHAAIISPAANFMVARLLGDGHARAASALNDEVRNLPAQFTHRTVVAYGPRIRQTYQAWGSFLTDLTGKHRPDRNADLLLSGLSYWTDNGAAYYYNYDMARGYAATLLEVITDLRKQGIAPDMLQLDSWWYQKTTMDQKGHDEHKPKNPKLPVGTWNAYGGLLTYEAHPDLFPKGLADFQKQVGLPLITHNRWIDPASAYHQKYKVSGYCAVDPKFWDDIADYLVASGIKTYEQDWLNWMYDQSPELHGSIALADVMTDEMARACRERGITLQYCMAQPRHFLEGTRYDNLTTIRTCEDKFGHTRWQNFLFVNQLASALGEWPWADVCRSKETANMILQSLSAGPVGIGDALGETDVANLRRIGLKPDVPIVPTDETYVSNATTPGAPILGVTWSQHEQQRTLYLFGFSPDPKQRSFHFRPADYGLHGAFVVYDWRTEKFKEFAADATIDGAIADDSPAPWGYWIIAPLGPSGIALIGQADRFVPASTQRIDSIVDDADRVTVMVNKNAGEPVTLFGYGKHVAVDPNTTFDAETMKFTVRMPENREKRVIIRK